MKRLSERNKLLLFRGLKMAGTYDPTEVFIFIEEDLYVKDTPVIERFLRWCHESGRTFGPGNVDERFTEYLKEAA
jgi:hypothetical protein